MTKHGELADSIILRDVVERLKIRDTALFNLILQYIIDTIGREFSAENIVYNELIIKGYDVYTGKTKNDKVYVFIDEIHFIKNWQNYLKTYFDRKCNIKFIITGSSSIHLFKDANESLLGRIENIYVLPLTFNQFMNLYMTYISKDEYFEVKDIEIWHCYNKRYLKERSLYFIPYWLLNI